MTSELLPDAATAPILSPELPAPPSGPRAAITGGWIRDEAVHVRNLLEQAGLDARRIQRVSGYADRKQRSGNPMDAANNRIEVILLR